MTEPKLSEISAEKPDTSGRTKLHAWLAVIFVIMVYYGAQVVGSLITLIYPTLRHWSAAQGAHWLQGSVIAQFVFIASAEAFTVGSVYLYLRKHRAGFASIGLQRPRWSDLTNGLLAVPLYYLVYLLTVGVVSHLVPALNVSQAQEIGFSNVHGLTPLVLTFISLVVLPPLTEEILVRGFLYSRLKKAMPLLGAVLLTSAIFAAAHLPEGGAAGPLYIAALDTFVLSLVLIYLREKTGSLWSSITLHAVKNGVAFVALFILHVH